MRNRHKFINLRIIYLPNPGLILAQNQLYYFMNSLKKALGTQSQLSPRDKEGNNSSLLKGVNKSKSQGLWSLDMQSEDKITEESLNTDNLMRILNQKLQASFRKDSKNISDITFERIIQEFQDEAGGTKSELTYLMVIEDKLTDILQFAKQDFKPFLEIFNSMLANKISKLRKKQKKAELNNFDKIVSGNFKKKTEEKAYLKVEEQREIRKSKEKQRQNSKSPRKASGSTENKLNRLFSKQKNPLKQRQLKESAKKNQDEQGFNATTNVNQDESVSFSAVLSTTMNVKTRKRKASTEYKKQKGKKVEQTNEDKEQGDEAFMFFRPKKGKK